MGTDIKVFLEHRIDHEWVLVDVDPVYSAERAVSRRERLFATRCDMPSDLSPGVRYWIEGDEAMSFVTCLDLKQAAELWGNTREPPISQESSLISYFGLYKPLHDEWRVVVAV